MMAVTGQAREVGSGAWGQAARACQAEGFVYRTLSLREQGSWRKSRSEKDQGPSPTLSFLV
jgi:hypothetical protein